MYTPNKQMVKFFKQHINPTLDLLLDDRYSVEKIRMRLRQNMQTIFRRYGMSIHISLSDTASKDISGNGGHLPMGASVNDGKPTIIIFMPVQKMLLADFERVAFECRHQMFENSFVIGFLHETDHLASGFIGADMATMVPHETQVWAATCEYTIRPLLENGRQVCQSDTSMYQAWVAAGRDENNESWRAHIRDIYGNLKRHQG